MKRLFSICLVVIALNLNGQQRQWSVEYMPGIAWTPDMPLKIQQSGYPDIHIKAKYKTRSLEMPVYYSYRLTTLKNNHGWSLELNHLKIYLKNTNSDINYFSVSHGYNQIYLNHHFIKNKLDFISGLGVVVGHPENTIRNLPLDEKKGWWNRGYYLSGITLQGALRRDLFESRYFTIPIEMKGSIAFSRIPVANGKAYVPVIAFGILIGLCLRV